MNFNDEWEDKDAKFDHRDASLLLDRTRKDALAKITPDSVEAFSYLYKDYNRANDMEAKLDASEGLPPKLPGERIGDNCKGWLDNILSLSPAGGGYRSKQVVQALRSSMEGERDIDGDLDTGGRGLKHRGPKE